MTPSKIAIAMIAVGLVAQPGFTRTTLGEKDRARVARAAPRDRDEVRACLIDRKKGGRKGAVVGAAGGAGTVALAGGNLGKSLLGAGVGALAGNAIGRGTGTSDRCDRVLDRNR